MCRGRRENLGNRALPGLAPAPLYREGEIVHVRNELVPYSQLTKSFTPNEPWALLKKRKIMTDEGLEISEWNTTLENIQQFLVRLGKSPS